MKLKEQVKKKKALVSDHLSTTLGFHESANHS